VKKILKVMALSLAVCAVSVSVSTNVYADIEYPYVGPLEPVIAPNPNPNAPGGPLVIGPPQDKFFCYSACQRGFETCLDAGICIVDNVLPHIPIAPHCDYLTVSDLCSNSRDICERICDLRFP
jgi:hypothetical protein